MNRKIDMMKNMKNMKHCQHLKTMNAIISLRTIQCLKYHDMLIFNKTTRRVHLNNNNRLKYMSAGISKSIN